MSDIKLNLINHSNDQNNSEIVFFQKNVAASFGELSIAWRVVKNLGQGWEHVFVYPLTFKVSARDGYGNQITSPLDAENGQSFSVIKDASGDVLKLDSTPAGSSKEVDIKNSLPNSSVEAQIYKDGKLLASKTSVPPSQKAVFQFLPKLYVGVASQVVEGQVIDSAIISTINTELNLDGIASADIIMTGGGTGKDATAFEFHLENIVEA